MGIKNCDKPNKAKSTKTLLSITTQIAQKRVERLETFLCLEFIDH